MNRAYATLVTGLTILALTLMASLAVAQDDPAANLTAIHFAAGRGQG